MIESKIKKAEIWTGTYLSCMKEIIVFFDSVEKSKQFFLRFQVYTVNWEYTPVWVPGKSAYVQREQ